MRCKQSGRTGARHGYENVTRACRLAHGEAVEACRLFVRHVDRVDARAARACTAERDKTLHRFRVAFEHRLDRSVRTIRDPAGNAVLARQPPRRVAEEHALHQAMDDDAAANDTQGVRSFETSCCWWYPGFSPAALNVSTDAV